MEVCLENSQVQNKQEKQIKFHGQAEQGVMFYLRIFSRQSVALSGKLLYLIDFLRHAPWAC